MSNILKKMKDYMLGAEEDDYEEYDDYEETEEYVEEKKDKKEDLISSYSGRSSRSLNYTQSDNPKIVNIHTNVKMQVMIINPQTVDEAGSICDYVKSNKTVVVNLETTKYEIAQRIVDFLGGVAYALDGDIQCVSNKIFIIAPKNVDISGSFKEDLKSNGLLYSFAQSIGSSFK